MLSTNSERETKEEEINPELIEPQKGEGVLITSRFSLQEEDLIYNTIYNSPFSNELKQNFDSLFYCLKYPFQDDMKQVNKEKKKKLKQINTRESVDHEKVFSVRDGNQKYEGDEYDVDITLEEINEQFDPTSQPQRKPRWKKRKKQQQKYSKNSYQQLCTGIQNYLKHKDEVKPQLYFELDKKSKKVLEKVLGKHDLKQVIIEMFNSMKEIENKIEASKASKRQKAMNMNLLKLIKKKFHQGKYKNTVQQSYDNLL